jgi:hypothetical protein
MLTGDPISTAMNVATFAFIGFCLWMLLRKGP